MRIRILTTPEELQLYDLWLRSHPDASLWQSLEWKTYMEARGHNVRIYILEEQDTIKASALTVIDRTSLGFATWEIPRGPLGSQELVARGQQETLLKQILVDAKCDSCITLFLSPLTPLPTSHFPLPAGRSLGEGWTTSHRHVYPEATRIIDLAQSEENLLAQMHQKGRYNIRRAQKHGIMVKQSDDTDAFYTLLRDTGSRDSFTIHPKSHYEEFLRHLKGSFLLLAFTKQTCDKCRHVMVSPDEPSCRHLSETQKPIAGLLGVIWESQGIYYYGASSYASRALMAPYLVQWEAMRHCKARGCETYDLLGIAPPPSVGQEHSCPTEGDGMQNKPHPWGGISAFKEKFGGKIVTYPPEQQMILRPIVAKVLEWKRKLIG